MAGDEPLAPTQIRSAHGSVAAYRVDNVNFTAPEDAVRLERGFSFYPVRTTDELDELCRRFRAVILVAARTEPGQGEVNAMNSFHRLCYPQVADLCAAENLGVAWVNLGTRLVNLLFGRSDPGGLSRWLRVTGHTRSAVHLVVAGQLVRTRVLRPWADVDVLPATKPLFTKAEHRAFRDVVDELLAGSG